MKTKIPTKRDVIPKWAAFIGLAFVVACCAALLTGCSGSDNSDMPDGRKSGVRVRTDALSGCQYLESSGGGLTPRLDRDGKQVCAALMVGAK